MAGDRFAGIKRLYTARRSSSSAARSATTPSRGTRPSASTRACASSSQEKKLDHHVRPVLARPGRRDEADGHRGHLPRRLGDEREGLGRRGSRAPTSRAIRSSQVPDEAAGDRPRAAHRRPNQFYARSRMTRGAAQGDARGRLPAVHHRRRRHRPRRRRPRAQPDSPLRRGRRPRLPHRGSEARREEVRPPGRQGARLRGRADQAPQRRALPARHHAGAGHHRRAHRRRVGHAPRRPQRRARSAVHPRRDEPRPCRRYKVAFLAILRALHRARHRGAQRPPALRD